jgi:sucrose-6-phosphatase
MTIRLLSFDIDGTLLDKADSTPIFRSAWEMLDKSRRPLLCYNTGRLLDNMLSLIQKKQIPPPAYIISGIGTNIYNYQENRVVKAFSEVLDEGWNLDLVLEVMNNLPYEVLVQPDYLQGDFKSSWFFNDAADAHIKDIEQRLEEIGLDVNVVYSNSRHLDVLPKWANKGNALQWLLKQLAIPRPEVVVAGDSGNDNAMFLLKEIQGIIVANAQPELYAATKHLPHYHAERTVAEGVLEGLVYYNVMDEAVVEQVREGRGSSDDHHELPFHGESPPDVDEEKLMFIRLAYQKAVLALKKNITPLGFSAASLEDNTVHGTDENYRSVWARDGSMAIIGSLPLIADEEIFEAQRQTLKTLLDHIAPNGQIPSNVSIDSARPDYSGVGGICSVDSALWCVIAFYEFVKVTRDFDFLRQYSGSLQRVMNWLSALDSNNDALLEIPEAGDWTDLLGFRYNILYDEVLWYRTNICFGRMLEWLGDETRAGDYLRWSQVIKKEILINFWPSTQKKANQVIPFFEKQYSLGDTQYLIAQVTPFDFSWRCDVYANILAFLHNVLDSDHARQAFQFMWGVGVNEPYPVANLYPPISAGDQEWQSYYVVNQLNLPHQYHNGGIWPFIGAQWVRFINKLEMKELAIQELLKVAELNRLGVNQEWEFNEWIHAHTGRPMGKAFQAWSASEFILACHDLKVVQT